MSHFYRVNGTFRPNFLESEVGLVLKTYQIPASMGVADEYGNKIVAAGTVFPSNDGSAAGIVLTMWMSPTATTKGASCWLAVF